MSIKSKKKVLIFIGIILTIIAIPIVRYIYEWNSNGGTDTEYQHDADIVRMRHLLRIGEYLEEYKEKTGKYPFVEDSEIPMYIIIATEEQKSYIGEKLPFKHTEKDVSELIEELQKVLGQEIKMPYDPQRVPVNKPNFYIYMTQYDYYNLAIHLHNEFSFTKNVEEHYNKLEISNKPSEKYKIWSFTELMQNKDFIKAYSEEMYREGYFEMLENKQN